MAKTILRYFIALIMIPVGVVLGLAGLLQNHFRRQQYRQRKQEMERQLAAENQPGEKKP